ncbi:MAG: D-glycero-beta-D-manno-heptose-7-phosphate kinase [Planctomycetota bacterium]
MNKRELNGFLERIGHPRVLIVGDLILDRYVTGDVSRISPEAPIPILAARESDRRLGGAGNVAANLRAMGAQVEVLGVVGDDGLGRALLELFEDIGVDVDGCVKDASRPTTEKTRLVSGVQQMLRMDWEDASEVGEEVAGGLVADLSGRIERADAIVLSDYGKGVLSQPVLSAVIDAARAAGVPVLVDPKGSDYARYRGATLVTPNKKEAEEALKRSLANLDDVPAAARELIEVAGLDHAVITLGPGGMAHASREGGFQRVPTVARQVFDVTGAGDTVIAHLALGLAGGLPLADSVALANHAAGIVVGRRGAAAVTPDELRGALNPQAETGKVLERGETLASQIAAWRSQGKRIAFTNGCFDVLHAGHVDYLRFARGKGDVLIVGVNDDASVRRLKGETRPVNPIGDRMVVLAALEMVDAVVAFGEDTPKEIVEEVTPDALIKGEDWRDKGVVGREWVEQHGGQVHLAPLVPGRSTTSILERAKSGAAGC